MPIVRWKKNENIAVLTMDNGSNLNNPQFFSAMNQAFEEIIKDEEINGVVLTASDPKAWNTGIDLEWMANAMINNDKEGLAAFSRQFLKMLEHILLSPFPVVAAVTGHAFANGAVLACACDFRFMRKDRGFFCFPEIDVNVPFAPGIIDIAKKAVPRPFLDRMIFTGKRYTAKEMEDAGIIEKACENAQDTLEEAIAFTKSFRKGRNIFYQNKKVLNEIILKKVDLEYWKENQI